MNSIEIREILRSELSHHELGGVLCLDEAKEFLPNKAYVINTDKCDQPGLHWLGVYYPPKGEIEFFDSYGIKPDFYGFSNKFLHSNKRIQSLNSKTCGPHVISFLLHRLKIGYSFRNYLKLFNNNFDTNDRKVHRFIENNYNISIPLY